MEVLVTPAGAAAPAGATGLISPVGVFARGVEARGGGVTRLDVTVDDDNEGCCDVAVVAVMPANTEPILSGPAAPRGDGDGPLGVEDADTDGDWASG